MHHEKRTFYKNYDMTLAERGVECVGRLFAEQGEQLDTASEIPAEFAYLNPDIGNPDTYLAQESPGTTKSKEEIPNRAGKRKAFTRKSSTNAKRSKPSARLRDDYLCRYVGKIKDVQELPEPLRKMKRKI